jgi:hypothetical protein
MQTAAYSKPPIASLTHIFSDAACSSPHPTLLRLCVDEFIASTSVMPNPAFFINFRMWEITQTERAIATADELYAVLHLETIPLWDTMGSVMTIFGTKQKQRLSQT